MCDEAVPDTGRPFRLLAYHARMSKLIFNLRNVPDDEADDVRGVLESGGFDWYETPRSRWPFLSQGALWLRDGADHPRAKAAVDAYQAERARTAREAWADAQRKGTAETFADVVRDDPVRVAMTVLAVLFLLGLVALPILLLRG